MPELHPIKSIHIHAVVRYRERVENNRGAARPALTHMWKMGRDATDYQLNLMGRSRRPGELYRISECCYGRYLIVMRTDINQIRTLWKID